MTSTRAASLALAVFVLTSSAGPRTAIAADASEPRYAIHGFVDAYYAYNTNRPGDHANFFPAVGTSAKRDNEFSINLAGLEISRPAEPVGFKLALGFGTATEVVHAAEARGVAAHPDIWRNVIQASVQWRTSAGRGTVIEAGVFPSHIGMEAFATKDNWNYTRSWLGELSPYYQAGVKVALPVGARWSAQVHFLNGWQVISDNNRGKTLGTQVSYADGPLSVSLNGIAGPEISNDDHDVRALGDLVALYSLSSSIGVGLSLDVARQESAGGAASWFGVGGYARFMPAGSRTGLAVRSEYYEDKDGVISGRGQVLREVTVTLEHRPAPALILKAEGRYDRSSTAVFATDGLDAAAAPRRDPDQVLFVLSSVATF